VHAEILFVDEESVTASLAPALRSRYTVAVTSTVATAKEYLRRVRPALVILEVDVTDGTTAEICREAKSYNPPAAVLVTTAAVEKVPAALAAGCDGVLLKPFPAELVLREDWTATPRASIHTGARNQPRVARRAVSALPPQGGHEF